MTVGELKIALDDYGDHLEVMVVVDEKGYREVMVEGGTLGGTYYVGLEAS